MGVNNKSQTDPESPGHLAGEPMNTAANGLTVQDFPAESVPERRSGPHAGTAVSHAFDALYGEHFNFVWRSLRRLGVHPSWVEDAAQDTFLVVHRRLADLRPDASAKAFLFGIALRVARDYRRRAQRKHAVSLDVEKEVSQLSGPFERAAKAQAVRKLEAFLATLDEDRAAVFVLSELEGMTAPEISQALGANQNTVYSRLRTARERFIAFAAEGVGHD
ncbi:MAG: polymerase sigma factor RpoE [Myxococcaceae bacterium]|nr:polymerase sigma factor RpoE [Myxococcaceae bacterium]